MKEVGPLFNGDMEVFLCTAGAVKPTLLERKEL